jgi:polar amino acid transport system substrate-binding protein
MRKLLLLAFLGMAPMAHAATITFTTESYPPFSYLDGKEIKGAVVDQVKAIMSATGTDYTMELMPWARAYKQALTAPMTCVFATGHEPDRDKLFKWVEPLLMDRGLLVKHTGTAVSAKTMDEAKKYTIGTWREDYSEKLLEQREFPKIDVASDFDATLRKLLSDRIDLMPISESNLEKLKQDGQPVEGVMTFAEHSVGIACQKDFPDDLLGKMQNALNKLISDGTQKSIFLQYGLHVGG